MLHHSALRGLYTWPALGLILLLFAGMGSAHATVATQTAPYGDGAATSLLQNPLFIPLVLLSVTTAVSVWTSLWLYRWRRLLMENKELLVPEVWVTTLQAIVASNNAIVKVISESQRELAAEGEANRQALSDLTETVMTMQSALDDRDAEIKRLRQGHDAYLYKKFVKRFIKAVEALEDELEATDLDRDGMQGVSNLFEDALAECGVESFAPEVGARFQEADGVSDHPRLEPCSSPEDDGKIIEVIHRGYRLSHGQGHEVIVPAKVRIHNYTAPSPEPTEPPTTAPTEPSAGGSTEAAPPQE